MAQYLAVAIGFFKFFDEVVSLIKLLQKTPAAKHQEILKRIQAEDKQLEETGRPVWD
jgi:choline kinase